MLSPEFKIKSKLKDDVNGITIEELLIHGYINDPNFPNLKSVIVQPVLQIAGEEGEGGITLSDSDSLSKEITNATLTITTTGDYIFKWIRNTFVEIDLSVTNIEDVEILSTNEFDVYIINR